MALKYPALFISLLTASLLLCIVLGGMSLTVIAEGRRTGPRQLDEDFSPRPIIIAPLVIFLTLAHHMSFLLFEASRTWKAGMKKEPSGILKSIYPTLFPFLIPLLIITSLWIASLGIEVSDFLDVENDYFAPYEKETYNGKHITLICVHAIEIGGVLLPMMGLGLAERKAQSTKSSSKTG